MSSTCSAFGEVSTTGGRSGKRFANRLFAHGDRFKVGSLNAHVLFSPGHTLASIAYVIGDAAFVHDTLFMPDSGTARADFPGAAPRRCGRRSRTT
jgi:glyoxylase-like metal-dependent hydrolase (beta-lactamase superfamily II)